MKARETIKQQAKKMYMGLVNVCSRRAYEQKGNQEIAYLLSFPANDNGLILELGKQFKTERIVVYYTSNCLSEARKYQEAGITIYPLENYWLFFSLIVKKLARARIIICDNYFAFLGGLTSQAEIIQLWHANGATKRFGWQDQKTKARTQADQQRFQAVYERFDRYLVGSDHMGQIFKDSYRISDKKLLRLGVPRTDYFFDQQQKKEAELRFAEIYPEALGKRVLLYAPTYRDEVFKLADWTKVLNQLAVDSILICRFHPHMKVEYPEKLQVNPAVFFDKEEMSLAALLFVADCLVSDYSSVPFEYALANPTGQLVLYCPDLTRYQAQVGLQEGFIDWSQGKRATSIKELTGLLNSGATIDLASINCRWSQYNDGHATERFLAYVAEKDKEEG